MKGKPWIVVLPVLALLLATAAVAQEPAAQPAGTAAIQAPVLKWQNGGCYILV